MTTVKFMSRVYNIVPDNLDGPHGCDVCAFTNDPDHRCMKETGPEEDVAVVDCVTGEHHYEEVTA